MSRFRAMIVLLGLLCPVELYAQSAELPQVPQVNDTLDPESPLAPMDDLGIAWPDLSKDEGADGAAKSVEQPISGERRYSVEIEGLAKIATDRVIERFNALSALKTNESKTANAAQVARRAREDEALLDGILRAEGYYDAVIETRIENRPSGDLNVVFAVEPGPLYRFGEVNVTGLDQQERLKDAFKIGERDPVSADEVLAARDKLTLEAGKGFPFAEIGEPEVVVDHDTRTATLNLNVQTGGEQRIGSIRVSGNQPPFGARHVGRIARFETGALYDAGRIEDLRRALVATGLVSTVQIRAVPGSPAGSTDLDVAIEPAPARTIAGEFGYGTGEGIRAEASWTHRNLIRPEGAVTVRGIIGTKEQFAGVQLRQSNFQKRDQVLNARFGFSNVNRSAFDARTFEIAAGLERQTNLIWQKKWTWSGGVELLATNERDVVVGPVARKQFLIASLPLMLAYDGSNDLLDPTEGFRLSGRVSPEVSLQSGAFGYGRVQIDGSAYLPATRSVVVAGRIRLGAIIGANRDRIAPSRRFYSGGGGSVRGYGYQLIGPRDINNDPIGGRSLSEFALEARIRLKAFDGAFSVVPFVDGGNISTSEYPKFSNFRFGAGLGMRYHSSFGPIRIDVGTPINRQKGDSRITVFVSLGQAF